MIIIDLIFNLALLVSLSVLSGFIDFRWNRSTNVGIILQGLLFGMVAILGMLNPFNFAPGIIFDGRSVVLSLCALFFGPVAGTIAAGIALVYRIILGGDGLTMGVSVIISSAAIGIICNQLNKSGKFNTTTVNLYLVGLMVHLVMVSLIMAIPSQIRMHTFKTLTITILGIYPVATALIGKILQDQKDSNIRRIAETALRESEARYRNLFENSLLGISETEPDGNLINANLQFAKMFGYNSPSEMMAEVSNVSLLYVNPEERCKITDILNDKGILEPYELQLKRRDGSLMQVLMADREFRDDHGKLLRYQATLIDITERKKAEIELITAKQKAEESDRLKSAFLSNISHEIRTPMNGILGFTELLKEPELKSEEIDNFVDIIKKSSDRMLNTLSNIIDISTIDSGQIEVKKSETSLNELLNLLYVYYKPEVEHKGLNFEFVAPLTGNQAILVTDREKLYSIFSNLVKNAIKYTSKGSVVFGYSVGNQNVMSQQNSVSPQFTFFVKDTGIGIPKDRQEAIFERFVQADIEDKNAFQGSGLGLTITRAYVEMLGGNIWLQSEMGKGANFYFTIENKNIEYENKI